MVDGERLLLLGAGGLFLGLLAAGIGLWHSYGDAVFLARVLGPLPGCF